MDIIIIDDEEKARKALKNILKLSGKQVSILAEADCVKKGIEVLSVYQPDILFLDIEMPDGTGFDILNRLSSVDYKIIFVTAHQEYAVRAFKFSALDYILKPISPKELIAAIEKAEKSEEKNFSEIQYKAYLTNTAPATNKDKKIILKTSEDINLVDVNEIIRCEADGGYTTFYLNDGRKILVSKNLKEYDELLSGMNFYRTHHSHLVNINYIKSYHKREGGYLVMKNGNSVPVSFRKKDDLIRLFESF